jgi:hypothetical protein
MSEEQEKFVNMALNHALKPAPTESIEASIDDALKVNPDGCLGDVIVWILENRAASFPEEVHQVLLIEELQRRIQRRRLEEL